jgi:putative acyl-CoA dehydrogenase
MATVTRLDCALSSAGFMRQAFAQALHYTRNRHAFGKALVDQPVMTELLADMALESQGATLLAMGLASRFGSAAPIDTAWRRLLTPAAKFWNCKRAVSLTGEAMEAFGGNGYVEDAPMGRLFREAPVNSIWEGSGNVMCLDVLRAVARNPDDVHLVLDQLGGIAAGEPRLQAELQAVRGMVQLPPQDLERQARRFTQRLVLAAQACLMLEHASAEASAAFVSSRFDPDWGAVTGIGAGTDDPGALLRASWR